MSAVQEIHSTVRVGDNDIFVRDWPVESPRVLVVIAHGAGEHSDYWTPVARSVGEKLGAYVVGADFPGHGRSTGNRVEVRDVQDLVAVLREVVSVSSSAHPGLPVVLLGHSMGSIASVRYAQQFGDTLDTLVLHASPAMPAELWSPGSTVEMTLEQMTPDPVLQKTILSDEFRIDGPLPEVTVASLQVAGRESMEAEPLGALPLVWLHGKADGLIPYAGARIGFERLGADRGAFLGYPGKGHGGILESTSAEMLDDLADVLRAFLRNGPREK